MMKHGHLLVAEKAGLIHGIKNEIKKTSEYSNKVLEMQEMGKREAEFEYKSVHQEKQ